MQKLSRRKSQLRFETSGTVWDRGRRREICVEAHERFANLKVKNARQWHSIPWETIITLAMQATSAKIRRDKAAAKLAKKGGAR